MAHHTHTCLLLAALVLAAAAGIGGAAAGRPPRAKSLPVLPSNYTSTLQLDMRHVDVLDASGAPASALQLGVQLYAEGLWDVVPAGATEPERIGGSLALLDPHQGTVVTGLGNDPTAPGTNVSISNLWTRLYTNGLRLPLGTTPPQITQLTRTLSFSGGRIGCSYTYVQMNSEAASQLSGILVRPLPEEGVACTISWTGKLVASPLSFSFASYVAGIASGGASVFRSPMHCQLDAASRVETGACAPRPSNIDVPGWPAIQTTPVATTASELRLTVEGTDAIVDGKLVARPLTAVVRSGVEGRTPEDAPSPWAFRNTGPYASVPGSLRVSGVSAANASYPGAVLGASGLVLSEGEGMLGPVTSGAGSNRALSSLMPATVPTTRISYQGGDCTYFYKQVLPSNAVPCLVQWTGTLAPAQLSSPTVASYAANSLLSFPQAAPLVCNLDLSSRTVLANDCL